MRILKVISRLLDYPTEFLFSAQQEIMDVINESQEIGWMQQQDLKKLVIELTQSELLDIQEAYSAQFESGRSLSLWLFEHIHGESRDRGQAMVDLLNTYEAAGFVLEEKELPDYLPLYLEYLSTCAREKVCTGLVDIEHLLILLGSRLEERHSAYAACFRSLLQVAGRDAQEALAAQRKHIEEVQVDDSLEAIDAIWEEEAITFLNQQPQGSCQLGQISSKREQEVVPVHWVDFKCSTTKTFIKT